MKHSYHKIKDRVIIKIDRKVIGVVPFNMHETPLVTVNYNDFNGKVQIFNALFSYRSDSALFTMIGGKSFYINDIGAVRVNHNGKDELSLTSRSVVVYEWEVERGIALLKEFFEKLIEKRRKEEERVFKQIEKLQKLK